MKRRSPPLRRLLAGALPLALSLALALAFNPAAGQPRAAEGLAERHSEKQAAERQKAELQRRLDDLKKDMERTEGDRKRVADSLAHSERAISDVSRSLHDVEQERRNLSARLEELRRRKASLQSQIALRKEQLARLAREQYQTGGEDRLKLMLSGDDPHRINRDLNYLGYASKAQAALVEKLAADQKAMEDVEHQLQDAQQRLDRLSGERRSRMGQLEKEKSRHASLLTGLSDRLSAQRREASNLKRDEQRLSSLVDRLAKVIEDQRRADLAQAKKRKDDEAKRQRELAARERGDRRDGRPGGKAAAPAEAVAQASPKEVQAPDAAVPSSNGPSTLRGQLKLPVKGELATRFGTKREEGGHWKGVFIRAPEGAEVHAVASGRVAYAEWLRGFGNLLIVDHGNQVMSIYGNNSALLKKPGDGVKSGEVIASTGNSGGSERSGLYFELRHQGRAIDPLQWMASRR